ncbi:MAG TPA: hypothetical protein PKM21_15890 [Anaerolineales bacterium]|nr:hypothetical protein [Anaerolineales bacterium]
MARRKSGGFPWRAPRCYVCSKLAVMVDEKTGDYLCVFHHQARIALREAAKNLPVAPSNPKKDGDNG